jgi:putative FmdB family regulatory protein
LPIYEYECTRCPSRFELKRGFHDETPVSCPACGKKARRRFSSVPIIFKGSGFYVTDSKGSQSATTTSSPATEDKPASEPTKAPAEAVKAPAETAKAGATKAKD